MFKYLRLILTLALLSVVAHPSVAQNDDATHRVRGFGFIETGGPTETFELSNYLRPLQDDILVKSTRGRPPCTVSISINARDTSGNIPEGVVDFDFNLTEEEPFRVISIPYINFETGDAEAPHVIVLQGEISHIEPSFNSCWVSSFIRTVAPGGSTAGIGNPQVTVNGGPLAF